MVRRERIVNNAVSTLSNTIDSTTTSISVSDGTVFPLNGDYRLLIESEVVLVTSRSTNSLTVVRGVDGTTAASHNSGISVTAILTASGLSKYIDDYSSGASSRPPARLLDVNGNVLTSSSFTGVNMGTSSVSDDLDGGITWKVPGTTNAWHLQTKSPPSVPYIVTAKLLVGPGLTWSTSGSIFGIGFRESSTGEFILNYYETGEEVHFAKFDSPSLFNSFLSGENLVDAYNSWVWLQIEDDNTNLYTRVSTDGINFFEIGSEGRTAFLAGGPDQVLWAFNDRGIANKLLHLKSWLEE